MNKKRPFRLPLLVSLLIFIAILAITQYLSYQQYLISKEREHERLVHESGNINDKFRGILYNNITAANSMAIIYKEYGRPQDFDRLARQVMEKSKYVEAVVLTRKGLITDIYPHTDSTALVIGTDVFKDSILKNEILTAIEKRSVSFAGPRKLLVGGIGIWGQVPVMVKDSLIGFSGVLTRLPAIRKELGQQDKNDLFSCSLVKKDSRGEPVEYLLSSEKPADGSEEVSVEVPEGDWVLKVSYRKNYAFSFFPYQLSGVGFLLSFIAGLFAYRRLKEPFALKEIIEIRTHEVSERVKELSTIYQLNKILQDESQDTDVLFNRIVRLIPPGWQYPEVCEARISFDGKNYSTDGYRSSEFMQQSAFSLEDGRKGNIEVIYTEEKPVAAEGPFLKEERDLINSMAETVVIYYNKLLHQRALTQSEARFRGAFEHSATGMGIVSLRGEWLSVNKGLCEMTGYSEHELLALTFQKLTHPEDLQKDILFMEKAIRGETDFYRTEKRYIHKRGSIVWVSVNVALIRNEAGSPLYFVSQIENITDRIESQMKFRNLVEKSPVGVYIFRDGKFLYVNPTLVQESGYTEAELTSMGLEQYICREDLPKLYERITARLEEKIEEVRYEIRAQRKNGELIWLELFGTTTLYEGEPAIIGTMVNITERKNLELEKEKIVTDLLQRNRDLEQFSYIVSHNIRAPLASMLGLSSLLEEEPGEGEKKLMLSALRQQATKLDEVIKDVNTILNVRKELLQAKTEIHLQEVLSNVMGDVASLVEKSKARISGDFSAVGKLHSIHSYVYSIFFNLISNGIKYCPGSRSPEIRIWTEKSGDKALIYFRDNGDGIDLEKYSEHIFGLYKRFDLTKEGKGLGLFMVKTQAAALNGSVQLESAPGKGSTFIVTLPG